MKLIVDISEGVYKNIDSIQNGSIGSKQIINKVKNGIPLDDIKTEILNKDIFSYQRDGSMKDIVTTRDAILEIIDKYIGKGANE